MALRKSPSMTGNNKTGNLHLSIGQPRGAFGLFILMWPANSYLPNFSGPQAYNTF